MPPTRCPTRLRRLIAEANEKPTDATHPLRQILRAFQDKKQNKGADTLPLQSMSLVTINLADYSVTVRNELDLTLREVDLRNLVDLIRQCPVSTCGRLFWAGRADKKACDKHVDLWRKRNNRRAIKQRETVAAAKRRTEEARQTLSEMSRTKLSVIRAIMGPARQRLFWLIDHESSAELRERGELVRSTLVVRRAVNKLAKDGYLTYSESADRTEDRYEPTRKLIDLWAEIQQESSAGFTWNVRM